MKIAVGGDHAGFPMKAPVVEFLRSLGHEVTDHGTHSEDPVDFPDIAEKVTAAILSGEADRGVLVCGTGVGAAIAGNKVPGIRAALAHDTHCAHQGVEHDDMNVLVLGARVIGRELALELVRAFLEARFTAEERHRRRLEKVKALEARSAGPQRPQL